MYHYATIAEALTELNAKGFTHDFNLHTEDIKENPYVKIKGVYKGVFKATDLELGVAIESDGKKYYFRISYSILSI